MTGPEPAGRPTPCPEALSVMLALVASIHVLITALYRRRRGRSAQADHDGSARRPYLKNRKVSTTKSGIRIAPDQSM